MTINIKPEAVIFHNAWTIITTTVITSNPSSKLHERFICIACPSVITLPSNVLNIISFPFVNYDCSRFEKMTEPALLGETELHYLIFCNIIQAEFSSTIILQCTTNNNSSSRYDARWSDKPPIQKPLSGFNQKHAPGLEQTIQWFSN
jgi:hypothetical protein